jgi:phage gp36-like protein
MAYLTLQEFGLNTVMPASYVAELEAKAPGWITQQLTMTSSRLDSQLRKRYDVPFAAPAPPIVLEWVTRIVEVACWLKRGVRATDEQFLEYKARGERALQEIEQAANSETGLFDLPQSGTNTSAVATRGWPRSYSEQSPFVWADEQADVGHIEDSNRGGTRY